MKQIPEGCQCCLQAIDYSAIDRMLVKQRVTEIVSFDTMLNHGVESLTGIFMFTLFAVS